MKQISNSAFVCWGLAVWLGLMVVATADGIVRMNLLIPAFGTQVAEIISGIFMIAAIYLVTWIFLKRRRPAGDGALWVVGILWAVLTVGYELLIVILRGEPPVTLALNYHPARMLDGNIILPGIILMALAPWIVAKVQKV